MSNVRKGSGPVPAFVFVTDADGNPVKAQALVLVDAAGNLLTPGGVADAATETTLQALLAAVNAPATALPHQPLDASNDCTRTYARVTAAGSLDVVAAVASQSVRVFRLLGTISGAGTIEFTDGAAGTSLLKLEFSAAGMIDPGFWERGYLKTTAGNKLVMVTTGAVTVALNVWFTQAV